MEALPEDSISVREKWREKRAVAVPATLIAERGDLVRKRDLIRDELFRARAELELIRTRDHRRQR